MQQSIRILDKNINLIAEIDNYEELQIIKKFHKVGEFSLKINANKNHVDKLVKNNIILLGKNYNKVCLILHREFMYTETGEKSDVLSIKGVDLKGLLNRRLIVPKTGEAFESHEGTQEEIIKAFVNNNCVAPSSSKRVIDNLIISENKNLGSIDMWRSSYENLSDKIQEISEFCGLGWDITLDAKQKKFIFDVIPGKDLTINQTENPPIIFRSDFDNIRARRFTESIINSKNVVYAGAKEDATKLVISTGEVEGFERSEVFADVSENTISILQKEGEIKLKEYEELKSFELEIDPKNTFIYEKDYNLGDIVTIQDRKLKVIMDTRIVEVQESYNKNGMKLKITFGSSIPTLFSKIKRMVK